MMQVIRLVESRLQMIDPGTRDRAIDQVARPGTRWHIHVHLAKRTDIPFYAMQSACRTTAGAKPRSIRAGHHHA
jgi:hypothetical protein